jgi:hypothetical protein
MPASEHLEVSRALAAIERLGVNEG